MQLTLMRACAGCSWTESWSPHFTFGRWVGRPSGQSRPVYPGGGTSQNLSLKKPVTFVVESPAKLLPLVVRPGQGLRDPSRPVGVVAGDRLDAIEVDAQDEREIGVPVGGPLRRVEAGVQNGPMNQLAQHGRLLKVGLPSLIRIELCWQTRHRSLCGCLRGYR